MAERGASDYTLEITARNLQRQNGAQTDGAQLLKDYAQRNNAESTAVNTDPAKHTAAEQRVIDEYQGAVDDGIKGFITKVRALTNPGYRNSVRYTISPVTQRTAGKIRDISGVDVQGFQNILTGSAVDHIENRHGKDGQADRSMSDDNDLARIRYVLENYNDVQLLKNNDGTPSVSNVWKNSDGTPAKRILFSKKINGTYYTVEAAPDSKARVLAVESAYIGKKNARGDTGTVLNMEQNSPQVTPKTPQRAHASSGLGASQTTDASAPALTAKTENANTPIITSITDSPENSNSNFPQGVGAAERGFTDGEAQTSGLTGAPADGIVEPTNGNVERARALLADGATPSQVFNETGLIVMADGSMQDGFDGPVVWRANDGSSGISDSTADRRAERRGDRAGASTQDGRGNRGVGGLDYSGGRAAEQRTGGADLGGEQQRTATELIIRAANASGNEETAMIRAALGGDDAFAKRFYELYQQGDAVAEQWGNFFPNVNALIAELDSALSGGERSLPPGTGAASRGFAESPYAQWQNDAENLHNPGENAARNVSLPTENLQGRRTMKGGQTVMESANTPEYRAEQIADLYLEGRMSFDPKTNPALAEEARRQKDTGSCAVNYND